MGLFYGLLKLFGSQFFLLFRSIADSTQQESAARWSGDLKR